MKIAKGSIVASAMMLGAAAVYAQPVAQPAGRTVVPPLVQPGNSGANGVNGVQSGGINNAGATAGTGMGTAAGMSPMSPGAGAIGRPATAPGLNNMRANGTSLNMNPDPRAPNLTGKGATPGN